MVANGVLFDKNLSLKAKGLYAYLYSKPDGWDFSGDRIVQETKDKRVSVFNALKELEKAGYLKRTRMASGRMSYSVIYPPEPVAENQHEPVAEKAKVQKPHFAEISSISNKDKYKVIKNIQSNTIAEATKSPDEVNELLAFFQKTINPHINFANATQRKSAQELIKSYGLEKTLKVAQYAISIQGQAYAPVITTPHQLKEKFSQLISHYKRNQQVINPTYNE